MNGTGVPPTHAYDSQTRLASSASTLHPVFSLYPFYNCFILASMCVVVVVVVFVEIYSSSFPIRS